ncbi:MAG: TadE/TadG family type IV pilus assembly protein [Pseudooceanicola sp.]
MIRSALNRLRLFSRDSRGSVAVVDFAIMFPIFLTMFLSGVEMGMMTIRQTMMEHALDRSVRDLRLSASAVSHDALRDKICGYAGLLPDCQSALKLEMRSADMRTTTSVLSNSPDCVDRSEEIKPVVAFVSGKRNELMVIRACFVFSPVFPNVGFGHNAQKDGAGDIRLFATTAFVNEPS